MILLGDASNKKIADKHGLEHFQASSYNQTIPYYHVSSNAPDYEKFCFERWFIINNFIKSHTISEFIHSDSDNAFFTDISQFTFKNARIGMNGHPVVPNVFFSTADTLDKICKYYCNLYSLPMASFTEKIDPYAHVYSPSTQHYSDMMFLQQAINELSLEFVTLPEDNASLIFNANMRNYSVAMRGNTLVKTGTSNQLVNLHLQGDLKPRAKYYLDSLSQK